MRKIILSLLFVSVTVFAIAAPVLAQTEVPPTPTPPYVIENTVSVGEYGIATILAAQCLLLIVMATGAALWGFMQKRR